MRVASLMLAVFMRSSRYHHPGQIALGVTIGILLGLMPTISLPFLLLFLLAGCLRIHLPALVLVAMIVKVAAPAVTPALGWIGLYSLTHPNLVNLWQRLDRLPLMPWLCLHNTVVHGSLAVWMVTAWPVFVTVRQSLRWLMPESEMQELLAASGVREVAQQPPSEVVEFQELRAQVAGEEAGKVAPILLPAVVIPAPDTDYTGQPTTDKRSELPLARPHYRLDAPAHASVPGESVGKSDTGNEDRYPNVLNETNENAAATTEEVIQRAASLAAWADDAIASLLRPEDAVNTGSCSSELPAEEDGTTADTLDDDERWLIETTMEVVRIAEHTVSQQAANKFKVTTGNSMTSTVNESPRMQEDLIVRREQSTQMDLRVHSTPATVTNDNQPREEALQYLLRHLKGVQEKVKKL